MESAQGPEKAVGKSKPPGPVTFSQATIPLYGKLRREVRGRTPRELTKQIAEQIASRISSDDRFGLHVWPQPSLWEHETEYQTFLTPVS
jgi:hypothetical protein